MLLEMCKSKIHRARLTHCDLDYEGSLEIDIAYLEKARMLPYAIPGERGSGVFRLNGAAAHKGNVGDIVTIMSFANFTPEEAKEHLPDIIVLNEKNEVIARRKGRKVLPLD